MSWSKLTNDKSNDVHNIEFYSYILQSKADKNKDGKIEGDFEISIFNNELKKFDMNNNGKIDEDDVIKFKNCLFPTNCNNIQDLLNLNHKHIDFSAEGHGALAYLYELGKGDDADKYSVLLVKFNQYSMKTIDNLYENLKKIKSSK